MPKKLAGTTLPTAISRGVRPSAFCSCHPHSKPLPLLNPDCLPHSSTAASMACWFELSRAKCSNSPCCTTCANVACMLGQPSKRHSSRSLARAGAPHSTACCSSDIPSAQCLLTIRGAVATVAEEGERSTPECGWVGGRAAGQRVAESQLQRSTNCGRADKRQEKGTGTRYRDKKMQEVREKRKAGSCRGVCRLLECRQKGRMLLSLEVH
eukprot:scaffold168005_cov19-Tisochrysis_lutea.AAC.1